MLMRLIVAVTLILQSQISIAQQSASKFIDAYNNVSQEISECTAYFAVGLICSRDKLSEGTRTQFQTIMVNLEETNLKISSAIGLSEKARRARFDMAIAAMRADLEDNCINFSILLKKYNALCTVVANNLDSRVQYYLAR